MIDYFRSWIRSLMKKSNARASAALRFVPSSYADPNGRVFTMNGRLYRGVPTASAAFCERLFDRGIVERLVAKKLLVPTERSPLVVEGYSLVIEHERLPHVSYPFEWSGEMVRAAALHTIALLEELAAHGLTLKDAHGWNILFQGCRPVFVDFGSIVEAPTGETWHQYVEQEFRDCFLHPLELLAAGHGRVVRALMRDFDRGISAAECQSLLTAAGRTLPAMDASLPFIWYREHLRALVLPSASLGWSGYYDDGFPGLIPDATWTPKHRAVYKMLQKFQPATVLDIGANRGWYAMLAASGGAQVTAYDNDELCINQLFADAGKSALAVQPLVMSCLNPSPRCGIGDGVLESATERLQSDLVLALALVHHMVFKMHLNFDQIATGLAGYTLRTLIVEFPPPDDIHVRNWMTPRYDWYTIDNFKTALHRYFTKISTVASHPTPRVILVCERC